MSQFSHFCQIGDHDVKVKILGVSFANSGS